VDYDSSERDRRKTEPNRLKNQVQSILQRKLVSGAVRRPVRRDRPLLALSVCGSRDGLRLRRCCDQWLCGYPLVRRGHSRRSSVVPRFKNPPTVFVNNATLAVCISWMGGSAHVQALNLPHNSDDTRRLTGDVNTTAGLSVGRVAHRVTASLS
jgi:hypothetical protein